MRAWNYMLSCSHHPRVHSLIGEKWLDDEDEYRLDDDGDE